MEQAIAALTPLTEPTNAKPFETATAVAKILRECMRTLLSLQRAPTPPPKVVPKSPEAKKGRNELECAGVGWTAERVRELRNKCDQDKDVPYALIKEYVLDAVASDRQWALVRSYLGALYDASKIDGVITFNGKQYTCRRCPKLLL